LRNKLSKDFCILKITHRFGRISSSEQTAQPVTTQRSLPLVEIGKSDNGGYRSKDSSFGIELAKSSSRIESNAEATQKELGAKSSRIKSIREIVKGFYKKNLDIPSIHQLQQRRTNKVTKRAAPVMLSDLQAHSRQPAMQSHTTPLNSLSEDKPPMQCEQRLVATKQDSNCKKDLFFSEFFSKNYSSIVQVRKRPSTKQHIQLKQPKNEVKPSFDLGCGDAQLRMPLSDMQYSSQQPGTTHQLPDIIRHPDRPLGKSHQKMRHTSPSRAAVTSKQPLERLPTPQRIQRNEIVMRKREKPLPLQPPQDQLLDVREAASKTQTSPKVRFVGLVSPLPFTRFSTDMPSRLSLAIAELSPKDSRALSPHVRPSPVGN
jgi:hypothetical protein